MRKVPKSLWKVIYFLSLLCITFGLNPTGNKVVLAQSDTIDYTNPEEIIITTPKNGYSTTAEKVSILGASDYRYPLYMNGKEIETTEHGFFTQYVSLKIGDNQFIFENNGKISQLTITRKQKKTSSGTSSGTSITYKEYTTDVYGVVTSNYAMPRTKTSSSDVNLKPLARGTTFKLLGEKGSYYKIADGTYVAKSSIKKYNKPLARNKVSNAKISYKKATNQLVTELSMNINTLYQVRMEKNNVYLTLYNTTKGKSIITPKNDTVKKVSIIKDYNTKTLTYCFELYDSAEIYGYDILFNNGVMKFEMKVAPYLQQKGCLVGTTVFLDAGHGASDSGALGPLGKHGPMEKDINLDITLYAKEYLESLGAKVVLSRSDDTFYSLTKRVSMIRNLRPDISVSIHGNSLDLSSNYGATSGFLTYYSYKINKDVPSDINESISNQLGFTIRSTRQKSLSLTRLTTCPGILLETKFLSNPNDYEYLIKEGNQKAFGYAIGKAVEEYLESIAIYPMQTYIVQKGDSLYAIADKFNTTVEMIAKYNHLENINYIYVGQKLKIPTSN